MCALLRLAARIKCMTFLIGGHWSLTDISRSFFPAAPAGATGSVPSVQVKKVSCHSKNAEGEKLFLGVVFLFCVQANNLSFEQSFWKSSLFSFFLGIGRQQNY